MTYYCFLFVDVVLFLCWTDLLSLCCFLFVFFPCSSMLSVSLEFTPPQLFYGSVLLIFLVCSCLVHRCCLCLLSSPLSTQRWGLCCSYFQFVLDLFTNVVDLWRSPPVLRNKISVVHFVLLLFLFTFLGPCCEDRCDCSVHLYPQLSV